MAKYNPSDSDSEFGAITMPTKPSREHITKQQHVVRQPAEGYNSADDDKASGYGKMTESPMHRSFNRNYAKDKRSL